MNQEDLQRAERKIRSHSMNGKIRGVNLKLTPTEYPITIFISHTTEPFGENIPKNRKAQASILFENDFLYEMACSTYDNGWYPFYLIQLKSDIILELFFTDKTWHQHEALCDSAISSISANIKQVLEGMPQKDDNLDIFVAFVITLLRKIVESIEILDL